MKEAFEKFINLTSLVTEVRKQVNQYLTELDKETDFIIENSEFGILIEKISAIRESVSEREFNNYLGKLNIVLPLMLGLKTKRVDIPLNDNSKVLLSLSKKGISLRPSWLKTRRTIPTGGYIDDHFYSLICSKFASSQIINKFDKVLSEEEKIKIRKIFDFLELRDNIANKTKVGNYIIGGLNDINLSTHEKCNRYSEEISEIKGVKSITLRLVAGNPNIELNVENGHWSTPQYYLNDRTQGRFIFTEVLIRFYEQFVEFAKDELVMLEREHKNYFELKKEVDEIYEPYLTMAKI